MVDASIWPLHIAALGCEGAPTATEVRRRIEPPGSFSLARTPSIRQSQSAPLPGSGGRTACLRPCAQRVELRSYTISTTECGTRGRSRVKTHPLLGRLRAGSGHCSLRRQRSRGGFTRTAPETARPRAVPATHSASSSSPVIRPCCSSRVATARIHSPLALHNPSPCAPSVQAHRVDFAAVLDQTAGARVRNRRDVHPARAWHGRPCARTRGSAARRSRAHRSGDAASLFREDPQTPANRRRRGFNDGS